MLPILGLRMGSKCFRCCLTEKDLLWDSYVDHHHFLRANLLQLSQISSNGENVIGESVTRHFTGEFSVYSMAIRPAGSGSSKLGNLIKLKNQGTTMSH